MPLTEEFVLKGRYVCERALRTGGQGTVWRGHDLDLWNAPVAIKTLREDTVVGREELFQRFVDEAKLLVATTHGGLPFVRDFVAEDDAYYLVMEFIEGEDLDERVRQHGRLSDGQLVDVGVQVAEILEHLHRFGIAHLDVKPANLKLMDDGRVKLVDFGIATPLGQTVASTREYADQTTQRRVSPQELRAGSPGFAAPEQYGNGVVSEATDVYGLGCTLYTLATGRRPPDALARSANDKRRLLVELVREGTEVWLAQVIARAMAVDPTQRYESMTALRRPLGRPAAFLAHYVPEGSRRRRSVLVGVPMAAAAAVVMMVTRARNEVNPHYSPVLMSTPVAGRAHNLFGVGDKVALGSYALTVLDVVDPYEVERPSFSGSEFFPTAGFGQPDPGKRHVRVDVQVDNTGSKPLDLLRPFVLNDDSGHRYYEGRFLPGLPRLASPIGLHASTSGALVFDLPLGTPPHTLAFAPYDIPYPNSGDVTVLLRL